jgi:hypothetical protein
VIRFGAFTGVTTWATLGLSNHHVDQSGGRGLHQEFLMHVPVDRQPAGVLFQVAGEVLARGTGLAHGEVIGPRGRLFAETELTALVAFTPVYPPDAFAVCETPAAPVVLTWLVPITGAEARFAAEHGWRTPEAAFVDQTPDPTTLSRTTVPLHAG